MFDEKAVVVKILAGNLRAFELLIGQYQDLVFHMVNRIVDEEEDRKDICQEVFIKIFKGLPNFRFQSSLATWIARIAYHCALSHLKKSKKLRQLGMENIETLEFADNTTETGLDRKEIAAYINRLVAKLPEQYKTVLTLHYMLEFSYPEIMEITGMPIGTIKSNLYKARQLLKKKLSQHLK